MHCPRLELLLYIFRLLTTVQILTKGVAAPPLRLTSGVAVLMIQRKWNYNHDGLLLEMICNPLNHDNNNHDNNNHYCLNHNAKRHIHLSRLVSSTASRQPYIPGIRRNLTATRLMVPCPVDVPPEAVKITTRNTEILVTNWVMW